MTGYPGVKSAVEAMRTNAYDYLIKPFRLETILSIIDRAIEEVKAYSLNVNNEELVKTLRKENEQLRKMIKDVSSSAHTIRIVGNAGLSTTQAKFGSHSIVFDGNPLNYILSANLNSWLTLAFLGLIMQPIAYGAWYFVLSKYPVNKVMPIMLLLPITGLVTAIILLGEEPSKQVFLGGAIIIFGVSLILFKNTKKNISK